MKRNLAIVAGLVLIAASCAPGAASVRPTERPPSTATGSVPSQARELETPAGDEESTSPGGVEESATAVTSQPPSKEVPEPASGDRNFQPQLEEISISMDEVVTLLPPDAIPAVLPERAQEIMVPAADADAAGIDPEVQVIGVEINGESRAYPIPFLSAHEIVNTTIGGRPIAVTW